jgi:hypothetical protein
MPANKTPDRPAGQDGAEQDGAAGSAEQLPDDPPATDLKARFRQALDRKQGVQADGAGEGGHGESRTSGRSHGPARTQRTFRRKSG